MTVTKALPTDLIDSLLSDYKKPEDLIGEHGLLKPLTKVLVERALEAEMAAHLGHTKSGPVTNATGNTRNGKSSKTLKGEFGELPVTSLNKCDLSEIIATDCYALECLTDRCKLECHP